MPRPVVAFLRTNINWLDMTWEEFEALEERNDTARRVNHREKGLLSNAIQIWNDLFGVSYFAIRHRLRLIAETTWAQILDLDVFIKSSTSDSLLESFDDFIVMPVDDDDWFHPRVAQVLRKHFTSSSEGFYWDDAVLGGTHKRGGIHCVQNFALRSPNRQLCTNNYALTKAGYFKHSVDDRRRILLDHVYANDLFLQGLARCEHVPHWLLSMTNKTIASSVNLRSTEGPLHLLTRLKTLIEAPLEIPQSVMWASGYIRQIQELNRELYESASGHARL